MIPRFLFADESPLALDELARGLAGDDARFDGETAPGLAKRLKYLAFLPHWVKGGSAVPLTPAEMDPGFYDGATSYRIDPKGKLQTCLELVLKTRRFAKIKVALVDLTAGKDELAGVGHQAHVFAASVPKIATLLAAFQLQHDLRVIAHKRLGSSTSINDFQRARDLWADTQTDPGGKATRFTTGIERRGDLVIVGGKRVALEGWKPPRLSSLVDATPPFAFVSTGEDYAALESAVDKFGSTGRKAIDGFGFLERMKIVAGGLVPASNYVTHTLVRDLGFLYIASVLLQYGLYDPARGGGLWLGADYAGTSGASGPVKGGSMHATAGSLATYMTLLVRDRLVSPLASAQLRALLERPPTTHPMTISYFKRGLEDAGLAVDRAYAKIGASGGNDDCAYIERTVGKTKLRYVAVGLRAASSADLKALVVELDRCVRANNGLP